jgi:hypothetical protein
MHEGIKMISVFLLQGSVVCNMYLPLRDPVTDLRILNPLFITRLVKSLSASKGRKKKN